MEGEYVRVLVKDAIQPLAFCGAQGDGLYTLAHFVESQHYARNDGEGVRNFRRSSQRAVAPEEVITTVRTLPQSLKVS